MHAITCIPHREKALYNVNQCRGGGGFLLVKAKSSICIALRAGLFNWRPAGQLRPANQVRPARRSVLLKPGKK